MTLDLKNVYLVEFSCNLSYDDLDIKECIFSEVLIYLFYSNSFMDVKLVCMLHVNRIIKQAELTNCNYRCMSFVYIFFSSLLGFVTVHVSIPSLTIRNCRQKSIPIGQPSGKSDIS